MEDRPIPGARGFFEQCPIAMEAYDDAGDLIAMNPAAQRHFGVSGEAPTHNLLQDPDVRADIKCAFREGRIYTRGLILDPADSALPTEAKRTIWSRVTGFPVLDRAGRQEGYYLCYEDLSEEGATSERLGGEYVRKLLRLTNPKDLVAAVDWDGKVVFTNLAWSRLYGMEPDQPAGLPLAEASSEHLEGALRLAIEAAMGHAKTTTLRVAHGGGTYEYDVLPARWGAFVRGRDVSAWIEAQSRLRSLAHKVIEAREDEALRLSRELHDHVGGNLTAVALGLDALAADLSAAPAAAAQALRADVLATTEAVRHLSRGLRPPLLDEAGLAAALEAHAEECSRTMGLPIALALPPEWESFKGETAITVFRIAQEALTNVARHALPVTSVSIRGSQEDRGLVLEVQDDGAGFSPGEAGHDGLGLMGMRERALAHGGEVRFVSAPGEGTTVNLRIPHQRGGRA